MKLIYPKIILILFCFLFISNTWAQKQGSIWYFGKNAGLDFRSGKPVALTDGQLNTDEGCATICDANGNLLFYTDGVKIWNRQHKVMPNGSGLGGDSSATQSAVIVPHPGNTNEYYIFTVSSNLNGNGFQYNRVDMRLAGGLGDVIIGQKNVILLNGLPSTEKITAVRQADGINFWILAHPFDSDQFYIYELGTGGLEVLNPTRQSIGTRHDGVNRNAHGYMKFSPDGKKLAVALGTLGMVELFDFDNVDGELSNPIKIPIEIPDSLYKYAYGVEFSPDNSKLYVSFRYRQGIDQYDLKSSNIIASRYRIDTKMPIGAIQLAIDGKIYTATNKGYLGIINQPDASGSAVNYTEEKKGTDLGGRESRLGLPNYVTSYFLPIPFDVKIGCISKETYFYPSETYKDNLLSAEWDFGDTLSGVLNTSTEIKPTHIYNQPGSYWVTLKATLTNGVIKTYQDSVKISTLLPKVELGKDTTLCPESSLKLDISKADGKRIIWNSDTTTNVNSPYFYITEPGKYWVEVHNGCGFVSDTIRVNYYDTKLELPQNRVLCPSDSVVLDVSAFGAVKYEWQDKSTKPTYTVKKSGTYSVTATYANGCVLSRSVEYAYLNDFELEADTILCRNDTTTIRIKPRNDLIAKYLAQKKLQIIWSTGAFNVEEIKVKNPSTTQSITKQLYWAVLILENRCTRFDDIEITFLPRDKPQQANFFKEVCVGENVLLDATTPDVTSYHWSDNSTNPTLTATDEGLYWVELFNGNCSTIDTFIVAYVYPPYQYHFRTSLCKNSSTYLSAYQPKCTYKWQDGSTKDYLVVDKAGKYKVELTNACGKDSTFFEVYEDNTPYFKPELGPNRILCPRDSIVLDPKIPAGYEVLWQDLSETKTFVVKNEGLYLVAVYSPCDITFDTVRISYKKIPKAKFNDDEFICPGGSLDLDATSDTPGVTYKWFDSKNQMISTQAKITVNQIGAYTVEIEYGCDKPAKYQAFVQAFPEALNLKLGEDRYLCNQESIVLDAGLTNATYLWQDGSKNSTLNVNKPGKYWVSASINGCTITDTVNVYFLEKLKVDLGEDKFICAGEPLKLSATTAKGTYQWFDENNLLIASDSILIVNKAGKYRVKVDNGCIQGEDSIKVSISPLQLDLGNDQAICTGQTVVLDATFNDNQATYLWSNNTTNPTLNVSQSGIYKVKVFLRNCVAEDSIQVKFLADPEVNIGDTQILCPQEALILNAKSTNGAYSWFRSKNPTQVIANQSIISITEADTYWVKVDNGCKIKIDSIKIIPSNLPKLDLGKDILICQGASTNLNATIINGVSYQWFDINNNLLAQTPNISINQAGTYRSLVKGADGCTTQDTIQIDFKKPLPKVNLGKDTTLCAGISLILNAQSQDITATYLWQDGSTNAQFTVSQAGTYKVIVNNGCESVQDEIKVDFKPNPTVNLGNDRLLCPNETLVLDATYPNATYLWQDGSTNPKFTVTKAGLYSVEVNLNGCKVIDQISIDYKSPLVVDLGNDGVLCEGKKTTLIAGTDASAIYLWQDGSTMPYFEVTKAGTYSVKVDNGCEIKSDEIRIDYIPQPVVHLPNDTLLCVGQKLVLNVSSSINGVSYNWQDGSNQPTFTVYQAGKYWVEVRNGQCKDYDEINVLYEECLENVFIPNVITPVLQDGKNDTFVIDNLDLSQWILVIFNRQGKSVYRSENYQNDWAGDNNPEDVYYYHLKNKKGKGEFKGWIHLIK